MKSGGIGLARAGRNLAFSAVLALLGGAAGEAQPWMGMQPPGFGPQGQRPPGPPPLAVVGTAATTGGAEAFLLHVFPKPPEERQALWQEEEGAGPPPPPPNAAILGDDVFFLANVRIETAEPPAGEAAPAAEVTSGQAAAGDREGRRPPMPIIRSLEADLVEPPDPGKNPPKVRPKLESLKKVGTIKLTVEPRKGKNGRFYPWFTGTVTIGSYAAQVQGTDPHHFLRASLPPPPRPGRGPQGRSVPVEGEEPRSADDRF